jgi:hypothetical protein
MKIHAKINGKRYRAKLPYPDANHVVIDLPCPECGDCHAIVDTDTGPPAILALARGAAGVQAARTEWSDVPHRVDPPPSESKLRGLGTPREVHDGWDSPVQCCRCLRTIGSIHVRVSTLFGVREDRAVGARARCYG